MQVDTATTVDDIFRHEAVVADTADMDVTGKQQYPDSREPPQPRNKNMRGSGGGRRLRRLRRRRRQRRRLLLHHPPSEAAGGGASRDREIVRHQIVIRKSSTNVFGWQFELMYTHLLAFHIDNAVGSRDIS